MVTGTATPKRSARRPITMPPRPKPTISSVYASDTSAREAPNSACTEGSATTTDHMPTPPIVATSSAATSRHHA